MRRWLICIRSLAMMGCGGAFLAAAGWIFTPQASHAVEQFAAGPPQERPGQHAGLAKTLAGMIGQCKRVLAVHERGVTPFCEVMLWTADRRNPGAIDEDELAVISHSGLFHTITVYTMGPSRGIPGSGPAGASAGLDESLLVEPAFCEAWRALPNVKRQVIAGGISDMTLERIDADQAFASRLRLTLRWAGESADDQDEASITFDAESRRSGAQE